MNINWKLFLSTMAISWVIAWIWEGALWFAFGVSLPAVVNMIINFGIYMGVYSLLARYTRLGRMS